MYKTFSGIVTETRDAQSLNNAFSIEVKFEGSLTLVIVALPLNKLLSIAPTAMPSISSGIITT